jgi:uridylate kinase
MKKVIVVSLGGSQIIKDGKINLVFLKKFKLIIKKYSRKYKFVIVTGGGSVARMYIEGLRKVKVEGKLQDFIGISVTRSNARFVSYFFGGDNLEGIPHTTGELKKRLKKQDIVFTGALEYRHNQTTDSTSVQIARELKGEFVNITNVDGLYTGNPKTNKNAKLVREISWKDFHKIANKIPFRSGQHFVLDQKASKIIMEEKIKTYIVGNNLGNFEKVLSGKTFKGTTISL